jgi:hypothetical protein
MVFWYALLRIGDAEVLALRKASAKGLGGPRGREFVSEDLCDGVDEAAGVGDAVDVRGEFVQPERFVSEVMRRGRLASEGAQESRHK